MKPKISFEFFPPKTIDASFRLWDTVRVLSQFGPEFVSVTYGAGGSTRRLTHEVVTTIGSQFDLNVAAHLTCVGSSRAEIMEIAQTYARAGVKEIVALRGDAIDGQDPLHPAPDNFSDSCELIAALSQTGKFDITVGAYPDRHPDAVDDNADIEWLKRKVDAGATRAITQFFFEADTFFRFRDRAVAAGINIPIVPGVLPIENWQGTLKFAARCGAVVPQRLCDAFDVAVRDDRADLLAISIATELCTDLIEGGVDHIHFYTLNRPTLTGEVLRALGYEGENRLDLVA